ncbi:leucine-rich PPR motif-containing protein, mitochondrial-like [Stegodyphus dumicola]|uniref:leucine-rich PPR motif-containing protein, mitochondrial-like n=1 Tax=Stegodyphus dumicola TaxID=202533 RepID=UPI0015AE0946|nr:leucine-rich PPR motif-containing protein, mitochondrial-like [Stegodyphus dumicola]
MAKKYMTVLKEKHPTYKLDSVKVLEYAILLIKFSKLEEAIEVVKTECKELIYFGGKEIVLKTIKRFLNAAVETADIGFVQNVQNLLLPHSKTLGSIKSFLEPLVKIHLHKHDLESAINEYRNCAVNYKVAPCLGSLMKICISNDDHFNLQKIIDLTIANVGKMVAVNQLAVSFVETGRLHHALKVIKSVGKAADIYLEELCSKMFDENKVKQLEQLLLISKELQQVNREKIYYYLMKLYDNRNDYEKALDVWKHLQEDGIAPNEQTKKLYDSLLKRNMKHAPLTHSAEEASFSTESSAHLAKAEFLNSLRKEDIDTALSELQKMKKGYIRLLSFEELSQFIDLLVQNRRVKAITPNVQVMSYIIEYPTEILKPLLEKYCENGDVDSVNEVITNLPAFTQRKVQSQHFYYKTLIFSGKHEDVICDFEKSAEHPEGKKAFSSYAFFELLKVPDLRERAIKVAEKHCEGKFYLSSILVGIHYFINENYDKARELLQLHPASLDKVDALILRSVKETENVTLGMQYVKLVNELTAVKNRTKMRAFGNLLEILVQKEMYDEAVGLIKKAEEHQVPFHKYYQNTLMSLKTALENQNKPVPFNVPSEIKDFDRENFDSE